jgi:Ethanolamine utilization protein EutJ (predicted chaperonin)
MRTASLAGLTLLLSAQTPAPEQDLTVRVNVNLIRIDVVVQDRNGQPVPGLTADDFEVTRDGKRQMIQKVLYVARPRRRPRQRTHDPAP